MSAGVEAKREVRRHCPIIDDVLALGDRDWERCECGWPKAPCKEMWPDLRITITTLDPGTVTMCSAPFYLTKD